MECHVRIIFYYFRYVYNHYNNSIYVVIASGSHHDEFQQLAYLFTPYVILVTSHLTEWARYRVRFLNNEILTIESNEYECFQLCPILLTYNFNNLTFLHILNNSYYFLLIDFTDHPCL